MSGECCQWVLDAVFHTVEWLSQPLGFNSLALRLSLDDRKLLDNAAIGAMLDLCEGQRLVLASCPQPRLTIGAFVFLDADDFNRLWPGPQGDAWLKTTTLAQSGHQPRI